MIQPVIFVLVIFFGSRVDTSLRFLTEAQCNEAARKIAAADTRAVCVARDTIQFRNGAPGASEPPARR